MPPKQKRALKKKKRCSVCVCMRKLNSLFRKGKKIPKTLLIEQTRKPVVSLG